MYQSLYQHIQQYKYKTKMEEEMKFPHYMPIYNSLKTLRQYWFYFNELIENEVAEMIYI